MKLIHLSLVLFSAVCVLKASDQPLITEDMMPRNQNVRLGLVHDADGDVNGDDYHGFTVSYASRIYPIDQMVATYTQMSPENDTARQALISLEEYFLIVPQVHVYGVAGAGYMWGGSDKADSGTSDGIIGKLGVGLIFNTRSGFDIYLEYAMLAGDDDLWLKGDMDSTSNNRHLVIGFRYNY